MLCHIMYCVILSITFVRIYTMYNLIAPYYIYMQLNTTVDEISMLDGTFFIKLDAMARIIRGNQLPFVSSPSFSCSCSYTHSVLRWTSHDHHTMSYNWTLSSYHVIQLNTISPLYVILRSLYHAMPYHARQLNTTNTIIYRSLYHTMQLFSRSL